MSGDQQTIDDYVRQVERHLLGPAPERAAARAELVAHLSDAADAGDLDSAMTRLGTPEEAAATFAPLRDAEPVQVGRRFAAAVLDNLPLVVVSVALAVQSLVLAVQQGRGFTASFPPHVHLRIGEFCTPVPCDAGAYVDGGLLYAIGLPVALAWSIVGLGLLEAGTGTTPGKRWLGLRVVTTDGLRLHPITGIVRRLSLLAGPLAWLDWVPFLWNERRRLLELLTLTKVVAAAASNRPVADRQLPGSHPSE